METTAKNRLTESGRDLLQTDLGALREMAPAVDDFFVSAGLPLPENHEPIGAFFQAIDPELCNDIGMGPDRLAEVFVDFFKDMLALEERPRFRLDSLTLQGGRDKNGAPEELDLELRPGQIVCVVGPTGSGKSRLLADMEWMAKGDTPTGRHILINGQPPDISWRHSQEHRLFAQLSQNMNFVMDVNAADFVRMHAESRLMRDVEGKVAQVIDKANGLAGEPFNAATLLTDLSGGQSRALMIADIALLSRSPVVLIDEIENAGIDRGSALDLLVGEEKIVIIATHDPILALMGEKRLVLKNGGVRRVVLSSAEERRNLVKIDRLDKTLLRLRDRIRRGERIDFEIDAFTESTAEPQAGRVRGKSWP